jgi:hypothetical protein
MKTAIKNIKYIITVILFTTSCQLSEDLMDAMNEYNTDALLTVTVSPGAAAVYNNDAMVVTLTPSEPEFTIKYTTDGSDPSRTAGTEYTAPFPIDTASGFTAGSTIEIRVVAYDENRISNVVSRTVVLGDGLTIATRFEISTAAQLKNVSDRVNDGTDDDKYFRQIADIDLSSYATAAAGTGWTPIGDLTSFSGNYDGGNFTISNLTINSPTNNQGLFGNVAGNASLQNITLSDVNITGWGSTGALAGDVNGTGITVNNCDVTGTSQVFGVTSIGGLIGYCTNAAVTGCSSSAAVTGSVDNTGGLIGWSDTGCVLTNNHATGDVTGVGNDIGGFAGLASNTVITKCYAEGDVILGGAAAVNRAGGFIGSLSGGIVYQIQTSFSRGNVINTNASRSVVGGFAGQSNGTILNCYSTGDVQSSGNIYGGFVGTNSSGTITNCYSTGNVSVTGSNYGGFTGNDTTGIYTACFWLKDASLPINASVINDAGNPANLTNVTDNLQSAMYTSALYTAAGWDLATIWNITDGSSYPFLR